MDHGTSEDTAISLTLVYYLHTYIYEYTYRLSFATKKKKSLSTDLLPSSNSVFLIVFIKNMSGSSKHKNIMNADV